MKNKIVNCLILFIVGTLCIVNSIIALKDDINIDLSKSKQITSTVTYADIRKIEVAGLRYNSFVRVFYFTLKNSNENFAIQRSPEGYEDLRYNMQVGDTIKVYYRESAFDYNRHVFQVEKHGKILEDYKDYNEDASSKGGIVLFVGLVMTVASILWYFNFNLLKFLTSWVES